MAFYPLNFAIAIHVMTCIFQCVWMLEGVFFFFFGRGLAIYIITVPKLLFSTGNLKKLQGYHSSAEDFDGNDRPPENFHTPLAHVCQKMYLQCF